MTATITQRYTRDDLWESAPQIPRDRPPTRREVWEYNKHFAVEKTDEEIAGKSKADWVYAYVYYVNMCDWRMPPDWVPGELSPPAACPTGPIYPDEMQARVYELLAAKETA